MISTLRQVHSFKLTLATAFMALLGMGLNVHAESPAHASEPVSLATLLDVYKDPNCGCCNDWIEDRKSTRLNSSHVRISYAVFCLKKKKKKKKLLNILIYEH